MSEHPLVHMLANSSLSELLRSLGWVWPVLEIIHLFGLVLMFGSLLIFDLRVLGFAPAISLSHAATVLKLTLLGFAMNVITGGLLVLGSVHHFLGNPVFLVKMALIALAGLNALYFSLINRHGSEQRVSSLPARASAALSLLIWASVSTLARFISFVESG